MDTRPSLPLPLRRTGDEANIMYMYTCMQIMSILGYQGKDDFPGVRLNEVRIIVIMHGPIIITFIEFLYEHC